MLPYFLKIEVLILYFKKPTFWSPNFSFFVSLGPHSNLESILMMWLCSIMAWQRLDGKKLRMPLLICLIQS